MNQPKASAKKEIIDPIISPLGFQSSLCSVNGDVVWIIKIEATPETLSGAGDTNLKRLLALTPVVMQIKSLLIAAGITPFFGRNPLLMFVK